MPALAGLLALAARIRDVPPRLPTPPAHHAL